MKKDIYTRTLPHQHTRIYYDTIRGKFFEQVKRLGAGASMAHEISLDHVIMKLTMVDVVDSEFTRPHIENIKKFVPEVLAA